MKKWIIIVVLISGTACTTFFKPRTAAIKFPAHLRTLEDTLLFLYTRPPAQWPEPFIDKGVKWTELGPVPESPIAKNIEKFRDKIELGKMLFFDPRLSSSGKISCSSCHVPELSWTDGREKSIGHEQQINKRNSPSLLNVWFYDKLFWDGRSNSLEDQAFSPINNEREMHSSMRDVTRKLRSIASYADLFKKVYGTQGISPETITEAIAVFEKTLVSEKAGFDRFLEGDTSALNKSALRGLHLFRTKANCMNCHNGPLLTDNSFHNIGLHEQGLKNEDLGRYMVTHDSSDIGHFKTPSLRDVMRTGPWMHNGLFESMEEIINLYNEGMTQQSNKSDQSKGFYFIKTDSLIKKLDLTIKERADLKAFLESVTAPPIKVRIPSLPAR